MLSTLRAEHTKKAAPGNGMVPVAAFEIPLRVVLVTDAAGYRDGPLQARHQRRLLENRAYADFVSCIIRISSFFR
jgi:hypothetical protein